MKPVNIHVVRLNHSICLLTYVVLLLTLFLPKLKAQDSLISRENEKHSFYKVSINLFHDQILKGHLIAIKDSSVFVSQKNMIAKKRNLGPDPFHKSAFTGDTALDKNNYIITGYNYKLIESVKVTNQKLKTWTIVSGAVAGIIVGAIIGSSNGSDQGIFGMSSAEKGFLVGLIGGGVGALTGLAVSSVFEKKYLINGDWKSLEDMKATLHY